ncbi:DUF3810 domain-containing protein [Halosquirtibacter xylanolyticus]|uniref:DUF3810 family protein n=1 Tax=Halosquirtibacter xylanolyticus TaxID=3374599 RepID=UPI003749CA59|nr:DUF3810 domain-containing protein [Prolixibacteraceae bacterium]
MKLFIKRNRIYFGLLSLLLIQVLFSIMNSANVVSFFYLPYVYHWIGNVMAWVSGFITVSLWDIFWLLLVVYLVFGSIGVLFFRRYRKRYVRTLLLVVLIAANWFYISWGYCYGRSPIDKELNIEVEGLQNEDFVAAYNKIVSDISNMDSVDWNTMSNDSLIRVYRDGLSRLSIPLFVTPRRIKTMTFSRLYIQSGVLGYFGPFFNEVHINGYLYEKDYPFVVFHELSHQQGVGSERDCNFIAFALSCDHPDPSIRYSAYLNILPFFINYFYSFPKEQRRGLFDQLPKYVIEDLKSRRKWYNEQSNEVASTIQSKANDVYLKSNGVTDGVMDYGRYFGMVVSWINRYKHQ